MEYRLKRTELFFLDDILQKKTISMIYYKKTISKIFKAPQEANI
jgi:hypothetical protein